MNARIILAAVAALCCVQGMSAASLIQTLPWTETDIPEEIDFSPSNVEDVMEQLVLVLEKLQEEGAEFDLSAFDHQDVRDIKEDRAARNIIGCVVSVFNVLKTTKEGLDLFFAFRANKASYEAEEKKCQDAADAYDDAGVPVSVEDCLKKAEAAFSQKKSELQAQITPLVVKTLSSLWALRTCASII